MYVWTDTAPAKIINLNNCVSIEADEENSELYAIGNDGTRYFLHRFEPENDDDPRQAINAIRAIYEYLEEGRRAIDMSDIERELRPQKSVNPGRSKRRLSKWLSVTLESGRVIERRSQRETFIEAIEVAGIERVHALGLGTDIHPLVKLRNTDDPSERGRRTDTSGFYSIYVVHSAKGKKRILDKIDNELGPLWNVEVIDG